MIRFILMSTLLLASTQVFAADDGGFGSKFTNKTPAALMETPQSTIAQSVPDASSVQNIMPAAGEEAISGDTQTTSSNGKDVTQDILETKPTTVHESVESHVTVPVTGVPVTGDPVTGDPASVGK